MQHWLQQSSFQTLHYLLLVLAPFPWPFSSTKWRNSRPKLMNSIASRPRPRIMEQVNHDFTSTCIHFVLKYICVNWVCFLLHMIKIAPSFLMQNDLKNVVVFRIDETSFTRHFRKISLHILHWSKWFHFQLNCYRNRWSETVSPSSGLPNCWHHKGKLLIMQHVLWLTTHISCKPTKMVQPNTFPVILLVGKEAHWPLFCTNPMPFLVGPFKASPIYIFIFI